MILYVRNTHKQAIKTLKHLEKYEGVRPVGVGQALAGIRADKIIIDVNLDGIPSTHERKRYAHWRDKALKNKLKPEGEIIYLQ